MGVSAKSPCSGEEGAGEGACGKAGVVSSPAEVVSSPAELAFDAEWKNCICLVAAAETCHCGCFFPLCIFSSLGIKRL